MKLLRMSIKFSIFLMFIVAGTEGCCDELVINKKRSTEAEFAKCDKKCVKGVKIDSIDCKNLKELSKINKIEEVAGNFLIAGMDCGQPIFEKLKLVRGSYVVLESNKFATKSFKNLKTIEPSNEDCSIVREFSSNSDNSIEPLFKEAVDVGISKCQAKPKYLISMTKAELDKKYVSVDTALGMKKDMDKCQQTKPEEGYDFGFLGTFLFAMIAMLTGITGFGFTLSNLAAEKAKKNFDVVKPTPVTSTLKSLMFWKKPKQNKDPNAPPVPQDDFPRTRFYFFLFSYIVFIILILVLTLGISITVVVIENS